MPPGRGKSRATRLATSAVRLGARAFTAAANFAGSEPGLTLLISKIHAFSQKVFRKISGARDWRWLND
jgi:hypothetical protein